ncbi:elongation factor P maturation arginine rhamnosyltransferase EarP [Alysiella filiformis]|uniref:Protein-arginine rhamnosyltransferase n=1 Tax=Alysiella filiformis DSM 16848 TaxID=1120981 RepID=A0A286EPV3_9NEIS|nr:elongation factor P maturation arginine rhamnosyltransferase EarP [Alysiella filiformis]QMT31248.1 elongation factor P maturation arginine rhamnosyltransferase EarP [Alysiella filiformis]UBQ55751.1 elongation factor P maturation arginine rhamnosyltransferase EarP [Alysiella filiformis DSM 16848]SOD72839.1 conserved hypothetical protein, PP_1857 family [Alysiella filiformis DSM 16848]
MKTVWLFCTVIDNFGDIGVAWRLARELRSRLNVKVFLFLDNWDALMQLAPNFADERDVVVKRWREHEWADCDHVPLPDLTIETFACGLPESVLLKIKKNQSLWLNWEYLSAEDWAVKTHAMPSLQGDGYPKYFWQMGFVPESGGLIRERDFRLPEKTFPKENNALNVLIFGYRSAIWADILRAWQTLGWCVNVDLAGGQVAASLRESGFLPEKGAECVSGSLKIRQIDFVPQADFDDLLARYDWLFVRGEDSFVRAQFSGKPLFWHIYPQDELAHLDKLDAFWQTVFGDNHTVWQQAYQSLSRELNGDFRLPENERLAHWQTLRQHENEWRQSAQSWQQNLFNQKDALSRLADWLAQK